MAASSDPYQTLGVSRSASDAEVRAAYRRLVQLHHPDHNGGSAESAQRFEAVQEAYAEVRRLRAAGVSASGASRTGGGGAGTAGGAGAAGGAGTGGGAGAADPNLEARLAAMEQELKAARTAREQAIREAREATERAAREAREATDQAVRDVREMAGDRPSDEELGYYSTDDSVSRILDDAASELSERFTEARDSPAGHRVSDLIDELAAKLTGEHHKRK